MYTSQTAQETLNALAVPLLGTIFIGIVFTIIVVAFFVKIWIACSDVRAIKIILEESHPLLDEPIGADKTGAK